MEALVVQEATISPLVSEVLVEKRMDHQHLELEPLGLYTRTLCQQNYLEFPVKIPKIRME